MTIRREQSAALRRAVLEPQTERRVYNLPSRMVDGIMHYAKATGARSEVEAVRTLLTEALVAWERTL